MEGDDRINYIRMDQDLPNNLEEEEEEEEPEEDPGKNPDSDLEECPPEYALRLIPRVEWNAYPPDDIEPLSMPIRKVSFHYFTDTPECTDHDECCDTVQRIQKRQMEQGYPDIEYNFLIGNDGCAYEGRGWELKPEIANRYPACKDYTIDIAYIGDWRAVHQPYPMYLTAMQLVDWGVHNDYIHRQFRFVGFMEKEVDYSTPPNKRTLLEI